MRSKFLVGLAAFATIAGLINATPANAQMVQAPTVATGDNAVGFLVTYRSGVDPIAPNGEPTGENFAGVDLENSRNLGGRLYAVDFARDLTDDQAAAALENLKTDPRVAKVEFDSYVFTAGVAQQPIAPQILGNQEPVNLPIIMKTAITKASLAPITATDTWVSGTTPRVTVRWAKPTTRYSGYIVGYRVQIYASGAWRTLKSQTASTTRSYTTSTSYLRAGTESRFRVAAITYYRGIRYLGYYKYAAVTPTTAPKTPTALTVLNNIDNLQYSWTPYTSLKDMGGLPVNYSVTVTKPDLTEVSCTVINNSCQVTDLTNGVVYRARLTVTNDRASVSFTKNFTYTSVTPVNSANDTWFSRQWYLNSSENYSAKVSGAWATETGSPAVTVAVIDTGYTDHPDLENSFFESSNSNYVYGYDFITDVSSSHDSNGPDADAHDVGDYVQGGSTPRNSSWHGTHVMGIVAANDNTAGVVGVAPYVKLLPVRVLGAAGGTVSDIVSGINWAAGIPMNGIPRNTHVASVINLSIGGQGSCASNSATADALEAAKAKGITVVTAAGNDNGPATLSYPGNCYPTINIGATGKSGRPTFYSNYSMMYQNRAVGVDLSAPGGDFCQGGDSGQIYSTLNTGTTTPATSNYAWENGTSMASPVVAGIVALMYSAKLRQNPSVNLNDAFVESVWSALTTTATPFASQVPLGCAGSNPQNPANGSIFGGYGAGIVNASAAIVEFLNPTQ
jgi:serine protease